MNPSSPDGFVSGVPCGIPPDRSRAGAPNSNVKVEQMKTLTLGLVTLALAFTGCAFGPKAPFQPAHAGFFNNTVAPLSTEYADTPVAGLRKGEASAVNILGLFAFGDCGLRAAAEEGGLRTISFADYTNFNVLGVYQKTTVTVYGK